MTDESNGGQGKSGMTMEEVMRTLRMMRANDATEPVVPIRAQLLQEAEEITCGDRRIAYGDPVANHERIAAIASAATGHHLTAHDVVMVMIAAKMARARISPMKRDHYVDIMAYAGIAYECALAEQDAEGDWNEPDV